MMFNNSTSGRFADAAHSNNEKGFTVLEVIIAMVIFLIVTGAAYGVLQVAQRGRTTVGQQVQLTKNVRLALNLIGRDTYNAGFGYPLKNTVNLRDNRITTLIGVPNDTGSADDTVPPIIAGDNITTNTFAVPNKKTDQVTFLFKDSTFNVVGSAGPPDTRISQSLNISAINSISGVNQVTLTGSNTACSVKDIFVITGNNGSSTLAVATSVIDDSTDDKVQFASGDVLGFNQNGSATLLTGLTAPATMQRVRLVTYFVTADGTLTRREFANDATVTIAQNYIDEPLVYGVQNFQIQYVLADGTLSDNPSAGADGNAGTGDDDQSKLANIRQIRFTVDAKATDLRADGQPYQVTMTSTFGTRNLGYIPN